ncbi:MAG: M1 family metallopeptidase [Magnetovibrionaceae bacterium]
MARSRDGGQSAMTKGGPEDSKEPCRFCRGTRIGLLAIILWALVIAVALAEDRPDRPFIDLTVKINPALRSLEATGTIRATDGSVALWLGDRVELVSVEQAGENVRFRKGREAWHFRLPDGQEKASIHYRATFDPFTDGHRSFGPTSGVMGEAGAFLTDGSGWLPLINRTPADYRLTLTVPEPYRLIAPGRIVAEEIRDDQYTVKLASEHPQPSLPLMAGLWTIGEDITEEGIRVRTYFPDSLLSEAEDYRRLSAGYIRRHAKEIGAYPFSAFHVVSGPIPVGLGFPNMTYIGERVLRLPFIRHTSLGHEVLHNWWGNGVYADYAKGNWVEGLTTFMADYAYAADRPGGGDGRQDMRLNWLRDFAALPASRDTPIRDFVTKSHGAAQVVGYHKTAFVFHMLKAEIGTAAFDEALTSIWVAHRFRVAGWDDLRDHFERAAKRDLGPFFDQWINRTGAPDLRLGKAVKSGRKVTFSLSQEGRIYALDVPVRIDTDRGAETFKVRLDQARQTFALITGGIPTGFAIDPGFDLFRRLAATDTPPIFRDTLLSTDADLLVLGGSDMARAASRLAAGLFDGPPALVKSEDVSIDNDLDRPLMVVADGPSLSEWLAGQGLAGIPEKLAGAGDLRAWAARAASGRAFLVVEADDWRAVDKATRLFRHYGRRGYVVFEDGRAIDKGNWPAPVSSLSKRF